MPLTRRAILCLGCLAPPAALLAACGSDADDSSSGGAGGGSAPGAPSTPETATRASGQPASNAAQLALTPACGDDDGPTPAQTEGPFFTPSSPERSSLIESGMGGTRLVVEGSVLSRGCRPLARALVDFWQADNNGDYDNRGFRLRGHQFTDANGRYRLETILPGLYTGRTRHIHVKVQAPGQSVLTTQLYFPGASGNQRDGIFNQALLLEDYRDAAGGKSGRFDFVLNVA